jgi:hypothetical protein
MDAVRISFLPASVPEEAVRALWRSMLRRGHDVDLEDARLYAAMVIAALDPEPGPQPVPPPGMRVSGHACAASAAAYPAAYPSP